MKVIDEKLSTIIFLLSEIVIICHIKAEWFMPGKDIEDFLYGYFYVEEHIQQEERSF